MAQYVSGGRGTHENQFSPSSMWVLGKTQFRQQACLPAELTCQSCGEFSCLSWFGIFIDKVLLCNGWL